MIFFAQSALNQGDLVLAEAQAAGATQAKLTSAGVQFSGPLEVGYRFTMSTRISTRVLMALCWDEDIDSADKLYESSIGFEWEKWLKPRRFSTRRAGV